MGVDNYSIAIDGPAGAGKSTVAKKVAKILDIEYIDTGAMYRALTLKVINNDIDPLDTNSIIEIIKNTDIDFRENNIYLDGKLVNDEIRENNISKNVSNIAKIKEIRDMMLDLQRKMSLKKSIVMDGRDIGSIVLPNSKFKFFITATVEERASRRYKELLSKGEKKILLQDIASEIKERDFIDSNREIAPLKQPEDAYIIDTTNKTIDETVNDIIHIVLGR